MPVNSPGVQKRAPGSIPSEDAGAAYFVWSIWALLLLSNIALVVLYGRRLPWCDDWDVVEKLTSSTSHLSWLWQQHNEHRIPLPKLIWLIAYPTTNFDFRVPVLFNVALMAVASAILIRVARDLRGYCSYVDAVLPLAFLRLGSDGFGWSFEVQFTLSTFLYVVLLALLVRNRILISVRSAAMAVVAIAALPLIGASGIILCAALLVWLGVVVLMSYRQAEGSTAQVSRVLSSGFVATLVIFAAYFVGLKTTPGIAFQRVHDIRTTLTSTIALFNSNHVTTLMAFWPLSAMILPGCYLIAAYALLAVARSSGRRIMPREFGMLLFLGAQTAVAVAVGWTRGRHVLEGLNHYSMIMLPGLAWLFLATELYVPSTPRRLLQTSLLLVTFVSVADERWLFGALSERHRRELAIRAELSGGADAAAVLRTHLADFAIPACGSDEPWRQALMAKQLATLFRRTGR